MQRGDLLMLMIHNFWEMRSSEMSFLFGTAGSSRWVQGRHVSEVWRCLELRVQYSEKRLKEPPTRKSESCTLYSEHGQTSLTCLVRGPPPWWHQSPITIPAPTQWLAQFIFLKITQNAGLSPNHPWEGANFLWTGLMWSELWVRSFWGAWQMQNDSYSLSLARPYVSITSIVIFPTYHYHLLQILNYHFSVELPIDVSNKRMVVTLCTDIS